MEQTSLEDALNSEAKAETPEPAAEAEPKAETPEAEPAEAREEKPETSTVPQEALHAERERRKAAEKRFNDLSTQIGPLLSHLEGKVEKPKATEEPEIDFFKDPQGFIDQRLSQVNGRLNETAQTLFLNISEQMARSRYDDFDDAMKVFEVMAQRNPALRQQLAQAQNPGEWAYKVAREKMTLGDAQDLETYTKRLREQWEQEQAEAAALETEQNPAPNIPKTLATARNVGGKRTGKKEWSGPTPLEHVLAGAPGRQKS